MQADGEMVEKGEVIAQLGPVQRRYHYRSYR